MGRRRLPIDPEQVKELARIGCTKTEAATMLGCSVDTLDRRFAEFFQLGHVQGKIQLRRRQHHKAVEVGSDTMLMFLGKHRLGQTDKEGPDGVTMEDVARMQETDERCDTPDAGKSAEEVQGRPKPLQ